MAEVDKNGPTIPINVDTKQAKENLSDLDKASSKTFESMNESIKASEQNLNNFAEVAKKSFEEALIAHAEYERERIQREKYLKLKRRIQEKELKEQQKADRESSSGASNNSSSAKSSDNVARQSKRDQLEAKRDTFEQLAYKQRNTQIENSKQLLKTSQSMVLAVAGLAGGGIGAKAMLDFAHHIGRLQNFLKGSNSNNTNALAYRNEFRKRNVDDVQYWGAYQTVSNTLQESQVTGRVVDEHQRWAYSKLRKIDPTIQIGRDSKGALRTDQQFQKLINAFAKYQQTTPDDITMQREVAAKMFKTSDANFIGALMKGGLNISKADMEKARAEAKAMPENARLDAQKQELATAYETAKAEALAKITPTAIDFMKALTVFVSNHGQLVLAGTALATFSGSILGLLGVLKLTKGLLPSVGMAATKTAPKSGLGSALWRGAKWGGNKVWDGTKWIAGKGVEASEWVERNPKAIAKGGGRLAGAAPMVAWDLTVGNITDAQSTSVYDQPRYDRNGKLTRTGRQEAIEKAVNGKISQSSWNNKYYVQTKGGVYVYIDSQFYEPIEQIKRRLDNKQIDIPNQPSTGIAKSIADAIIPSARAGDLYKDRFPHATNSGSGGKLNSSAVQSAFKILTSKDENGSFTGEQAKGIIANLMGESGKGLNHQAIGDGGKAFGVAQWHSDRQANFKRIFGHDIRQSTLEEQIKFLKWEMQNTEKAAGDKIRQAKNANEATIRSVAHYERPKDIQGQSIERMNNIAHVNSALNQNKVDISPYQRQAQTKQAQANNTTHNINNSPTVNIHVTNGSVENVKKAVKQAVDYPSARNFNGLNGMS